VGIERANATSWLKDKETDPMKIYRSGDISASNQRPNKGLHILREGAKRAQLTKTKEKK